MSRYAVKSITEALAAQKITMVQTYKADRTRPVTARNMTTTSSGWLVEKDRRTEDITVRYSSGTFSHYTPANLEVQAEKIVTILEEAGYACGFGSRMDEVEVYGARRKASN